MHRSWIRRSFFLPVASILWVAAPAGAQSLEDAVESFRNAFRRCMDGSPVPGISVAVMVGDELAWAEGFGLADLEHQVPVTTTTLFRAWSVSKPMTAAAAALLHERGLLDLDAPVRDHLPSFPEKSHPITTRQLAGHRSGIPHYGPDDLANHQSYASVLAALDKFKDRPLLFEPGTSFEYSTFGYNLIGAVVEAAAETPYLAFMEAEVFLPLGMRHTRPDRYREVIAARTSFYDVSQTGEVTNAPFTDNSDLWPGGGFLSTPTDLVRFGAGLLGGDLVGAETLEEIFTPMGPAGFGMDYGLGWYVQEPKQPEEGRVLMHHGGHYGGTAMLVIWERSRMVMAIMANATMTDAVFGELFRLRMQTAATFLDATRPS